MTVNQIILEVAPYKPMSERTLYTHLRRLKIKPRGKVRQCPQHYPDDAPKRILTALGIKPKNRRAA